MPVFLSFFIIFAARLIDVTLMTIRMLMIMRGKRLEASLIGFFEMIIYMFALSQIFHNLDNFYNIIAFALGFSSGNYLGMMLEEKMAMGFVTVHVISKGHADIIIESLREAGFGVTVVNGMGRYRLRKMMYINAKRKDLPPLLKRIDELDREAFVTVLDTKAIKGGFMFNRKDK